MNLFKDKKSNHKNTGIDFENLVYDAVCIHVDEFFMFSPNVKVYRKKGYYSMNRNKDIITDVSIELYIDDPTKNISIKPSIIIIIECKDYKYPLPVDDVEEFHAKLQQIGADNTKGVIITSKPLYQESAINYAKSNGIMIKEFRNSQCVCYELMPFNKMEYKKAYINFSGKLYNLSGTQTKIGRSECNDLVIPNKIVSRHHCIICKNDKMKYMIQDCQSTNGTYVNNRRIFCEEELHNGDLLILGNERLQFILEDNDS